MLPLRGTSSPSSLDTLCMSSDFYCRTRLTEHRESTSIPTNPRTTRPVGYAFVDLTTAEEAEKAIEALSGQTILDRKVSVQLARKPESAEEKAAKGETGENQRRRGSGRGRGGRFRGRGGRGGARGGRVSLDTRRSIQVADFC